MLQQHAGRAHAEHVFRCCACDTQAPQRLQGQLAATPNTAWLVEVVGGESLLALGMAQLKSDQHTRIEGIMTHTHGE